MADITIFDLLDARSTLAYANKLRGQAMDDFLRALDKRYGWRHATLPHELAVLLEDGQTPPLEFIDKIMTEQGYAPHGEMVIKEKG